MKVEERKHETLNATAALPIHVVLHPASCCSLLFTTRDELIVRRVNRFKVSQSACFVLLTWRSNHGKERHDELQDLHVEYQFRLKGWIFVDSSLLFCWLCIVVCFDWKLFYERWNEASNDNAKEDAQMRGVARRLLLSNRPFLHATKCHTQLALLCLGKINSPRWVDTSEHRPAMCSSWPLRVMDENPILQDEESAADLDVGKKILWGLLLLKINRGAGAAQWNLVLTLRHSEVPG